MSQFQRITYIEDEVRCKLGDYLGDWTQKKRYKKLKINHLYLLLGGERGIRTPGTGKSVRQFSKLLVSATHPSHQ